MLNKALLKAIPTPSPQSGWLDLAKQAPNIHYFLSAQIKVTAHQQVLILDMYTYNNLINIEKSTYRVFLTAQDDVTLYCADGKIKWLTSRLSLLISNHNCIFLDVASVDAINRFFKSKQKMLQNTNFNEMRYDPYAYWRADNVSPQLQAIFIWQGIIRQKKLEKRHQAECHLIDKKMRTLGSLPKSFLKWVENEALYHSRYIYYQYERRKVLKGFCTHCLHDVQVTGARHNQAGICPNCGSPITFKAISRSRHIADETYVTYFQRIGKGFAIRYFHATKSYEDYYHPKLTLEEEVRTFYFNEAKQPEFYYYGEYKNTGVYRWCPTPAGGIAIHTPKIYGRNLPDVLQGTPYQYCAIDQYISHTNQFIPYRYLQVYKICPGLEYLVKTKLFRLINYFMDYMLPPHLQNTSARNLVELLAVNKYYLHRLQTTDAGFQEYKIYMKLSKHNLILNDKQLAFVLENFSGDTLDAFVKLLAITQKPRKTMNYLTKTAKSMKRSISIITSDWQDYLSMCQFLQYDLAIDNILYPQDLQAAHDTVLALYKAKENEVYDQCLAQMYPGLSKQYHYENDEFLIEVPKSQAELINESAALLHCVKNYTEKIINHTSIVLFLRQRTKPAKPFYTLEIRQGKIIQCRTLNNQTPEERDDLAVQAFLKQFEANVLIG